MIGFGAVGPDKRIEDELEVAKALSCYFVGFLMFFVTKYVELGPIESCTFLVCFPDLHTPEIPKKKMLLYFEGWGLKLPRLSLVAL